MLPDSNSPESNASHQEPLEGLGCGPLESVICKYILEPNVRVISSMEIKGRLCDHAATEGKGKENPHMSIVINNVMYLTCVFLGLIITKCDF